MLVRSTWKRSLTDASQLNFIYVNKVTVAPYRNKKFNTYQQNMAKFKKQVAKFKIYNLLEKNQVVLFYHYNTAVSKDWHLVKEQLLKFGQITSMLAKNKIAQKVITSLQSSTNPLLTPGPPLRGGKQGGSGSGVSTTLDNEFSRALFQGPTILLGCGSLDILETVLRVLKQEKGFFLLGGFYKHRVVSCREIEKLGQMEAEGKLYFKFVNTIKESPLRKLISLRDHLCLSCISEVQHRLLNLLKIRSIQLSTAKRGLGGQSY